MLLLFYLENCTQTCSSSPLLLLLLLPWLLLLSLLGLSLLDKDVLSLVSRSGVSRSDSSSDTSYHGRSVTWWWRFFNVRMLFSSSLTRAWINSSKNKLN